MTDRDLRRLSRADLLELLIIERKELDRLMAERSKMLKDMETLHHKLDAVNHELSEAQELLKQYYAGRDRQPYNGNGVYGMPTTTNGR